MTPESEEKQKNSSPRRKFLLRGLVICVFLALLPFAGIQAWKQTLFFVNKGLWEQNYQGVYLVGYTEGDSEGLWLTGYESSDALYWQKAEECLSNFGCEIMYNSQNYLPEEIHFNTDSGYYIKLMQLLDCTEAGSLANLDACNLVFDES